MIKTELTNNKPTNNKVTNNEVTNEATNNKVRLEQVRGCLRDYPASVVAASYAGDAPPLVPLAELVTRSELELGRTSDPVLTRFIGRLKRARPDLNPNELLALAVPLGAGDQEVYTARLGKWLFEQKLLEQALPRGSDS